MNAIDPAESCIHLDGEETVTYDKLVIATGAEALIPAIPGLNEAENVFTIRKKNDAEAIKSALQTGAAQVVVIGGGFIGLEAAAALKKLGIEVTVLEREERLLARVTGQATADFFEDLHTSYGVKTLTWG